MSLIQELKRRNVFKVGIAYLALGWVIIQVTDVAVPALNLPDVINSIVVYLGLIGFPFALFFAWAFELTPDGVKRSEGVDTDNATEPKSIRKLDYLIFGMLVLGLGGLYADVYISAGNNAANSETAAELLSPSIAVLAFEDFSPDKDQEYFADGISDEILNLLAKTRSMKVAGRTSSFSFKGTKEAIPAIADKLQVNHILEGSISKFDNKIKITAQLIRGDGYHVWSETYKRDMNDIFAIQEEIANAIMRELKVHLLGEQRIPQSQAEKPNVDADLYRQYLVAKQLMRKEDQAALKRARSLLTSITQKDPTFAEAQAYLAIATLNSRRYDLGELEHYEAIRLAEPMVKLARSFAPDNAETYYSHCVLSYRKNNSSLAEKSCSAAIAINPNHSQAALTLAWATRDQGRYNEYFTQVFKALENDPLSIPHLSGAAYAYMGQNKLDKVLPLIERIEEIDPDNITAYFLRVNYLTAQQKYADALNFQVKMHHRFEESELVKGWLGWHAFYLGFKEKALEYAKQPDVGIIYILSGEYQKGLKKLQDYRKNTKDDGNAAFWEGVFYIALDETEKAQSAIMEEVQRIKQMGGDIYGQRECFPALSLARFHIKLGKADLAAPMVDRCREMLDNMEASALSPEEYAALKLTLLLHDKDYEKAFKLLDTYSTSHAVYVWCKLLIVNEFPEIKTMDGYKRIVAKEKAFFAEQRALYLSMQNQDGGLLGN